MKDRVNLIETLLLVLKHFKERIEFIFIFLIFS